MRCINKVTEFFNIDRWQINQPIILADVVSDILGVEGVATVVKPFESSTELVLIKNMLKNHCWVIKWANLNRTEMLSTVPCSKLRVASFLKNHKK